MDANLSARFARFPRVRLGFYPTPLHRLDNLSKELGVELYIKREDFSGVTLFGGNKVRKLEYLLGEAKAAGAEYVFTYGATQSNHAMETAACCRRCGLKPVLFLYALIPPCEEDLLGNLMLDRIYGAEVHLTLPLPGETPESLKQRNNALGDAWRRQLEAEGHICRNIPVGGASALGSLGFAEGFAELCDQMDALGLAPDLLYHATGSGGTLAGLLAGRKLTGRDTRIVSIHVNSKGPEYRAQVTALANETLDLLGEPRRVTEDELVLDPGYYLPGYEQPNEASTEAIRTLARTEGLLVDPVYTGKAFAGLLDHIRTGRIPPKSTVVFLHTGGATALFAEKQILGDLLKG